MGRVFDIYLAKKDQPESDACAELSLPAAPYQLQDAFDKLRLAEGEVLYWEITEYHQFEELSTLLDGSCGLYDLNALAQKLSELDARQCTAFVGLLKMEQEKNQSIPISRLVDLAYSTDCCHVVDEALNDSQLGRFCAENGFVPGVEELPDAVFELLDFERIGREHRQREGGVLVERSMDHPGGYVERHDELTAAYKTLDLAPKTPDYTILLEVSKGFFHDLGYDKNKTVQLKLPASPKALNAVLEAVDAWDWREAGWRCLDCRAPALTEMISDAEEGIDSLNRLAQRLTDMEPQTLTAYKALLETTNCRNLQIAEQLMNTLDQYTFSPQYSSPTEAAKDKLSVILCSKEAARITPHLNLYQYGQELIQCSGSVLTGYGLIKRKDGQPIQTMEVQPRQDVLKAFPLLEELANNASLEDATAIGAAISEALAGRGDDGLRQFQAAMEFEDCASLEEAAEIAARLDSYEFVEIGIFRETAEKELLEKGLDKRVINLCVDFETYAAIAHDYESIYSSHNTGLYVHRNIAMSQPEQGMVMQ